MVNRLHREVKSHELNDRAKTTHRRADPDSGKTVLGDRSINNPLWTEFIEQALGDLVGALILGDFFAHYEHPGIAAHFLGHRITQGFTDSGGSHIGAGRDGRIFCPRLRWRRHGSRRSGSGRVNLGRGGRSGWSGILTFPANGRDNRADLDPLGPFRNQDRTDHAFVDRFKLHRRLVCLDLGEDVSALDCITGLDQPLGESPLLHRRRQCGHFQFDCHQ